MKKNASKYKLVSIQSISSEAFFNLIDSNKEYIQKGFSGTVKRCKTRVGANDLFDEWVRGEKDKIGYSFFIYNDESTKLMGLVNIKNIDFDIMKCEIGYFISQDIAGKGLVSNFTSDVIAFCFEQLQMDKIFLRIAPENIGSQKVAIKNGFKKEGVLRQEYRGFEDKLEDVMYFGLLRSEYIKE